MKKTFLKLLIVVLSLLTCLTAVFALTACGKTNSGEVTLTDSLGREFSINPDNVNKVVCIGAGSLRLYSYVADMSKLCAVEDIEKSRTSGKVSYRAYQIANEDLLAELNSCGAGGPQAQNLSNLETLIALKPDVIFSCLSSEQVVSQLPDAEAAIGCPIVTLKYGQQKAFSQDILNSITLIGKVMKCETRAKEITDYMTELKADIAAQAEGKTSASVYLACNSNWGMKGFLSTAKNYPLFTISGITNVMDNASYTVNDEGYADLEAVVASGADKIILDAGGLDVFKSDYNETGSTLPAALSSMTAFANKEVYLMMPNNAYDANVETYFINAYYALKVAYGIDINMQQKANEITRKFLGKDLYNDIITYGGYQKLDLPDTWPTK